VTNTAAVNGNRKATTNDSTGEIIDLGEEKVYSLNLKKKEYTVETFDQIRKRMREEAERARQEQEKQQPTEKGEPQKPEKEYEIDFDVKSTGQKKAIAGYDTHETIATVTVREKGKTLEESGGLVMTSDLWLAPRVPELKEARRFRHALLEAAAGRQRRSLLSPEQMAQLMAMFRSSAGPWTACRRTATSWPARPSKRP
jgi:hypothetical protein